MESIDLLNQNYLYKGVKYPLLIIYHGRVLKFDISDIQYRNKSGNVSKIKTDVLLKFGKQFKK